MADLDWRVPTLPSPDHVEMELTAAQCGHHEPPSSSHELKQGGRVLACSLRNSPCPVCLRVRSVVGDREPHSPELADELAVGRMQAGAELLRGGGGKSVRQGGLELGDAPRDCLVRRMDSKAGGCQKGYRIHAGGVRVFGSVEQHLGEVYRRHDERHAAVTAGGVEPV